METKPIFLALFGVAVWSLSSFTTASWNTGPCSSAGTAPCIETEINGNTYHFNGGGSHAGVWHGRPAAEGGGDFSFSGFFALACDGPPSDCILNLTGEVKKCQDSNGGWRIGVRVNDSQVDPGDFLCNFIALDGFPWYSKDPSVTSHCPFTDDCDNFIPYDPNASSYTANFGLIDIDVLGSPQVVNGHLHGVVFNPGAGANFAFYSDIFDCRRTNQSCRVNGTLSLDNGTSLDIN